jgi:hypothetical protein
MVMLKVRRRAASAFFCSGFTSINFASNVRTMGHGDEERIFCESLAGIAETL